MSSAPNVTVRVTRRFDASSERVFDAWLDPQMVSQWLFATPLGEIIRADIDARVGGAYHIVDWRDGVDVAHIGTYLEIDRPRRLRFTLSVPKYSMEVTRVLIELEPAATGCVLTLTHEDVLPDYADRVNTGWSGMLDGLAEAL